MHLLSRDSFLLSFLLCIFIFSPLHSHSGQVLMPQQPLTPCSCPWVAPTIAMATVFLQVLAQCNQCRAQTGTIWSQDTPRQLKEHSGHPSHAVICGLQGDGPHFERGVRKAHELREEGVGAAEVLIATVGGGMMVM